MNETEVEKLIGELMEWAGPKFDMNPRGLLLQAADLIEAQAKEIKHLKSLDNPDLQLISQAYINKSIENNAYRDALESISKGMFYQQGLGIAYKASDMQNIAQQTLDKFKR